MVQQSEVPQIEFLTRVAKLPVVSSAIEYATDTYGKAKESSPNLIQRTLSTAEDTVKYAAKRANEVVHTFERPIHAVDSLACKTLDKVEENIPIMKKTPDEIMTTTRSYVNEKWQPVHNQVESAKGIVATVTNNILNNPLSRFAATSLETTVTVCHDYLDYYIPPVPGESTKEKTDEVIPEQPTQKMMWSARRSFELLTKTRDRVSHRVQQSLRNLGWSGMVYTGALFELFSWALDKSKNAVTDLPNRMRQLIAYYRSQSKDPKMKEPTNLMDDAIFLARTLTGRVLDVIRQGMRLVVLTPGDMVEGLRYQLSKALQPTADFASSLFHTLTPGDFADRAEEFMKGNFTTLYQAFKYVKDGVAYRLGLTKLKDERTLQIEEERTKKYRAEKTAESTSNETQEANQNYPSEEPNEPEEQEQQEPSYLSELGVMSDTSY